MKYKKLFIVNYGKLEMFENYVNSNPLRFGL